MISAVNTTLPWVSIRSFTLQRNQQQVFSLMTGTPSTSTLWRTFSSVSALRPDTNPRAPMTVAGVSSDRTEMEKIPSFSMH